MISASDYVFREGRRGRVGRWVGREERREAGREGRKWENKRARECRRKKDRQTHTQGQRKKIINK